MPTCAAHEARRRRGAGQWPPALAVALALGSGGGGVQADPARFPEAAPLATSRPADIDNGRRIVLDRRRGMCLLCHSGPFPQERFQGNLAPSLAGAGSRWSAGQLRFRLIDGSRIDAETIMPPYFRAEGQMRVGRAFLGRTILSAEEIEDVTAYLVTLRD